MTETKRDALKRRLLEAAEDQMRAHGVGAVRARDVTKAAGCALGSLYNAYEDLDLLILAVNSRTLARLQAALGSASGVGLDPAAELEGLALAYLDFAVENPMLWAALFDHQMSPGAEVPDWHIAEHADLISAVEDPLARLSPALGPEELALRARTVFSAVHGIVKLSLEQRFVALSPDVLRAELVQFVRRYLDGSSAAR